MRHYINSLIFCACLLLCGAIYAQIPTHQRNSTGQFPRYCLFAKDTLVMYLFPKNQWVSYHIGSSIDPIPISRTYDFTPTILTYGDYVYAFDPISGNVERINTITLRIDYAGSFPVYPKLLSYIYPIFGDTTSVVRYRGNFSASYLWPSLNPQHNDLERKSLFKFRLSNLSEVDSVDLPQGCIAFVLIRDSIFAHCIPPMDSLYSQLGYTYHVNSLEEIPGRYAIALSWYGLEVDTISEDYFLQKVAGFRIFNYTPWDGDSLVELYHSSDKVFVRNFYDNSGRVDTVVVGTIEGRPQLELVGDWFIRGNNFFCLYNYRNTKRYALMVYDLRTRKWAVRDRFLMSNGDFRIEPVSSEAFVILPTDTIHLLAWKKIRLRFY